MTPKRTFWLRCLHCAEDGAGELQSFTSHDQRRHSWHGHQAKTGHTWGWRPEPEDHVRGTTLTASQAAAEAAATAEKEAPYAPARLVKRHGEWVMPTSMDDA